MPRSSLPYCLIVAAAMSLAASQPASASTESAASADQSTDQPAESKPADSKQDKRSEGAKSDKAEADQAQADDGKDDASQQQEQRRAERRERFFQRLFEDVELTDAEREQTREALVQAYKQHRAWRAEHRDELREICHDLNVARQSDDQAAVDAAREQLEALMNDAPPHGFAQVLDGVLDKPRIEQLQTRFDEMRQQRHERHKQRDSEEGEKRGDSEGDEGEDAG